jgi:drug/metabolite transporter (DMT)-like permease
MTPEPRTLGAFALMVVIGGSNIVAVRFSNQELPPFWNATLRFAGAAAIFFAIVALRRTPLPRGRAVWGPVLYGVFGGGASYALAYWALAQVNAGVAAVVLALVPLMTFFLAIAHRLETFSARGLVGALVAAVGIGLIFRDQLAAEVPLAPLLALLVATAFIAESAIVVKFFPRVDGFMTNAIGALVTVFMMLPLSLLAGEPRGLPTLGATWIALAYLIVVGSVVLFFLFLHILERWTASATSYALVLSPLVTIAVGAAVTGETVTAAFLAGGALVGLGVYLGAIGRPDARAPSPAAAEPAA